MLKRYHHLMARHIAHFSQRDRVQFSALVIGEVFLHGGKRWAKTWDAGAVASRRDDGTFFSTQFWKREFSPKTAVTVSRASGIALRRLSAAKRSE